MHELLFDHVSTLMTELDSYHALDDSESALPHASPVLSVITVGGGGAGPTPAHGTRPAPREPHATNSI